MPPTSARVAQEVYEPLIGIQYPMLCSRLGDEWQIGTTSIREDHLIASGLRVVQWYHASVNVDARNNPKNNPTVQVYQHLEFFPRVRTPCGHGAQVIVEGREKQPDGGENNKNHKHNPKTTTKGPRPSHHHHVVFPLC